LLLLLVMTSPFLSALYALFALTIVQTSDQHLRGDYVTVYSHCDTTPDSKIHKDNGLYYVKPSRDGPILPVVCSNGYTMIDGSLDLNLKSLPSFLSSYDYSRTSMNYIITNLDDTATFREWWLPADADTKFRVAKNCKSCESATATDSDELADNVVYYTDSSLFCYTWFNGNNPCAENVNEYACNVCDNGKFSSDGVYWTECSALQVSPDTPSWHDPQMRVNHPLIYRPVISMVRDQCVCYQPQSLTTTTTPNAYTVHRNELPMVTVGANSVLQSVSHIGDDILLDIIGDDDDENNDNDDDDETATAAGIDTHSVSCRDRVTYLTQNDFKHGTYRIRQCGHYVLSEDVVVNFNPPSEQEQRNADFSPNRIDGELFWFPTRQQSVHDDEYPGLYTYSGSYSLGFFAAITIESDHVIVDLNGYSLSMHRTFYLQQRFFSLIELAAKQFVPLQGPSTWGWTHEYYCNECEIRGPGTLGLTSHHAVHGNNAQNVYIHDLHVQYFDVAGIACNGCQSVRIEDVVIGPQNNAIPTLGRYTHARAFLPRLQHLAHTFGEQRIQFYGRAEMSVSELCTRLIRQMDMIYFNWVQGTEYDVDDAEWIAAQKLFKNEAGWMDGGSSYGLVINGAGAAVVGIGARTTRTQNITLNGVEIFGIYNQAIEKIKFGLPSGTTRGILFDAIDWLSVVDQVKDRSRTQYIGDAYTDVQFAAAKFIDSWYYRNSFFVAPQEVAFVFKGNSNKTNYPFLYIFPPRDDYWNDPLYWGCGTDIQLHSNKGAIGMMVNGAQHSRFNDIYIHDVHNWAELGSTICGPYPGPHLTIEDIDIQYGYTGTRAHGLVVDYTSGEYTNIRIENIESYHGEANGMTIYKESYVNLHNINVRNINAGTQLNADSVQKLVSPNLVPRACAVDIRPNTYVQYIDGDARDNLQFDANEIRGFEVCDLFVSNPNDPQNMHVLVIIFVLMMMAMTVVLLFVAYKIIKHCFCDLPRRKLKISNEQTPLLGI